MADLSGDRGLIPAYNPANQVKPCLRQNGEIIGNVPLDDLRVRIDRRQVIRPEDEGLDAVGQVGNGAARFATARFLRSRSSRAE
jgi:hypothetical protein